MPKAKRLLLGGLALAVAACQAGKPTNVGPSGGRASAPANAGASPAAGASGRPSQAPLAIASADAAASLPPIYLPARVNPAIPKALLGEQALSLLGEEGRSLYAVSEGGLISDQGGALIANHGGGIVSNHSGALVANNSGGIVSNHSGAYRLGARGLQAATSAGEAAIALFMSVGAGLPTPELALRLLGFSFSPIAAQVNGLLAALAPLTFPMGVAVPVRLDTNLFGLKSSNLLNAVAVGDAAKPTLLLYGVSPEHLGKPLSACPLVCTMVVEGPGKAWMTYRPVNNQESLRVAFSSRFDLAQNHSETNLLLSRAPTAVPYDLARYHVVLDRDAKGQFMQGMSAYLAATSAGRHERRRVQLSSDPSGQGSMRFQVASVQPLGADAGPYQDVVDLAGTLGAGPKVFAFQGVEPSLGGGKAQDLAALPSDPTNPWAQGVSPADDPDLAFAPGELPAGLVAVGEAKP